jgi:hypothetical protein
VSAQRYAALLEPRRGRARAGIALAGLAIAAFLFWRMTAQVTFERYDIGTTKIYVKGADDLRGPVDVLVSRGDAQAYVALGRDPTLSRPEVFDRPAQAAFRASRPLWGWLAWIASLGNGRWTVGALVVLNVAGAAFLVWALAGSIGWGAVGALFLPGTLSALSQLTVEPLGMALTWLGMTTSWRWLVPAALARETYLLIPGVEFLRTRRSRYLVPIAVWAAWQVVVIGRVGTWLLGMNDDRAGLALPQDGFLFAVRGWSAATWFVFAVMLCAGALAWRRFRPFIAAYAVLAVFLGWLNWRYWQHFSRQFLPVAVFGLIALAEWARTRTGSTGHVPLRSDA